MRDSEPIVRAQVQTHVERRFYALLLGDVFLLVVFLDISVDRFLFLHDANETCNLPSNAIADAVAATTICRWRDHK